MEFIQLPSFVQSADAACDRFAAAAREVQADIPGTIETVALNTVWVATWAFTFAAAFTFHAGQAAAEAWRTRNHDSIRATICAIPDADLDELVESRFVIAQDTDDLTKLTAHQLRPLSDGVMFTAKASTGVDRR